MLIFLVGFMGCGKSYIGRTIAPQLDYEYIDSDKFIEEKEGVSIKEIFEQKGEAYFRQLEHEFLVSLEIDKNIIVSTGGGMPCFTNNMALMNEKGLTIYLNRSKDIVIPRLLKGQHKRPLIAHLNKEQLEKFYNEKLESRKAFYEQATLFVGNADAEEIKIIINDYLSKLESNINFLS